MRLWLATNTPSGSQFRYIRSLGRTKPGIIEIFFMNDRTYRACLFSEKCRELKKR